MSEKGSLKGSILILDFGSQYTQLIARRVREHHVYCEIHPFNLSTEQVRKMDPDGIILSGGPASIYDEGAPQGDPALLEGDRPVLGICYGMHWIAQASGGRVARGETREYGGAEIVSEDAGELLAGLGGETGRIKVWMSHGDRIEKLPQGY